jgi:hypothetical protein
MIVVTCWYAVLFANVRVLASIQESRQAGAQLDKLDECDEDVPVKCYSQSKGAPYIFT